VYFKILGNSLFGLIRVADMIIGYITIVLDIVHYLKWRPVYTHCVSGVGCTPVFGWLVVLMLANNCYCYFFSLLMAMVRTEPAIL
jgi:hypothetical protein